VETVAHEPPPDLQSSYEIGPDDVASFSRNGHALVRGLASAEEVCAYRPHLETAAARANRERRPIGERDTYAAAFLQTCNLWRTDDVVRRFVFALRFAKAAADLLGVDGVRLYHDQALFKEPGGGHTPWHQDQFYWPLATEKTITMWMPLADLDPRVGSMTFATGSHLAGSLRGHAISDESEAAFDAIVRAEAMAQHTYGAIRAGDATFHAGWTLHRAGPNPTAHMRPAMTVIYFADGTRVSEPESIYQEFDLAVWLPGLRTGDVAASPINPLLWPAEHHKNAQSGRILRGERETSGHPRGD
jgi:ectoine hydroxylase-related dioxygenase (phytanoyl-CoA dioxygenase family)